jgi:hypothetical protein
MNSPEPRADRRFKRLARDRSVNLPSWVLSFRERPSRPRVSVRIGQDATPGSTNVPSRDTLRAYLKQIGLNKNRANECQRIGATPEPKRPRSGSAADVPSPEPRNIAPLRRHHVPPCVPRQPAQCCDQDDDGSDEMSLQAASSRRSRTDRRGSCHRRHISAGRPSTRHRTGRSRRYRPPRR